MAMKKNRYLDKSLRRLRRRTDDPEKTRAYTPGDIHRLAHETENHAGVIRPDTGQLNLPAGLDDIGEGQQSNNPEGVVLVIVALALIWIIIITYFVARMPDTKQQSAAEQTEQIIDSRPKVETIR